jgi:hypothetical protein
MIITWENRVERLGVQILLCPMHLKSTVVFEGSKTSPNCHYDKRVRSIDAKLLIRENPRTWGKKCATFSATYRTRNWPGIEAGPPW